MLENIASIFREKCGLSPDHPILVGVSGGADSLCLMDALHQAGYQIIVAHFDHQLRPDSGDQAESLGKIVARLKIPTVFEAGDVGAFAKAEGLSTEEAARMLRYRYLYKQAHARGAQAVAVGHTADDQVETVLMHFMRGAGLTGLTGMSYRSFLPAFDKGIPLVRPLLGIWREETEAYCAAKELQHYHDPSNDSLEFQRNRIRHELIPQMESYNPRFREAVLRMTHVLAEDHLALSEALDARWRECVQSEQEGLITFDASKLSGYGIGLQRNLIKKAMERLMPDLSDLRFSTLDNAAAMLLSGRKGRVDLPGNLQLFLEGNLAYLAAEGVELPFDSWPQMPSAASPTKLRIPGRVDFSRGWTLYSEQVSDKASVWDQARSNEDQFQAWLDASRFPGELEVRPPRPGDRFEPLGMGGHSMKLSDFFINEKLPRRARDAWPLLCSEDSVIWVPGYRPAHPFRLREDSQQVAYFSLSKENE